MCQYHHKYATIAEYIKAMELAQKQSEQAQQKITNTILVAMATKAFLDIKRYPKANTNWEERDHMDRTWDNWKILYLKAGANTRLKQKAKGHVDKCGGASIFQGHDGLAGAHGRPIPVTMDNLKGCFDNLATVAVAGKDDLNDLVVANLTLTKSVTNLTDVNAHLVKKV